MKNETSNPVFLNIEISKIAESTTNPRTFFEHKALVELSESIKKNGVLQNILVRPIAITELGQEYELVAGARRLRATKLAGLSDIPCSVRMLTDEEAFNIQVTENLHRADITPLEEAASYQYYLDMKTKRFTVKLIALTIKKSEGYVYARLQLLNLIDKAKGFLQEGTLPLTHAIEISKLPAEIQHSIIDTVLEFPTWGTEEEKNTPIACITLAKTRDLIRKTLELDLNKAPFDIKSKVLCPLAGSCTTCVKRTGHNQTLFNDLIENDTCMDKTCFNNKLELHVFKTIENLKSKKKNVIGLYYHGDEEALSAKYNVPVKLTFDTVTLESANEQYEDAIPTKYHYNAFFTNDLFQEFEIRILESDLEELINQKDSSTKEVPTEEDEDNDDDVYTWIQKEEIRQNVLKTMLEVEPKYSQEILRTLQLKRLEEEINNLSTNYVSVLISHYDIIRSEEQENISDEDLLIALSKDWELKRISDFNKLICLFNYLSENLFLNKDLQLELCESAGIDLAAISI